MPPYKPTCAFTTYYPTQLTEVDGLLGYEIDGIFIVVCDLRPLSRRNLRRDSDILEEFLEATPNLREQAKAGLITFSIQDGWVRCLATATYGPGSANRLQAIDSWMRANLAPKQYTDALKGIRREGGLPSCCL